MKTMTMTLCGKVCRDNYTKNLLNNQEKLDRVTEYVGQYFPANAIHFHNKEGLINESCTYPDYFAANWVVKEEAETTKQTVIVVHGNSYVEVNKKLYNLTKKINWN